MGWGIVIILTLSFSALADSASVPISPPENDGVVARTVEDYLDVINGVPIDYGYNETTINDDEGLQSVPGCPKSVDGIPWIYYGSPPKCYLAGEPFPCGENQKLFIQPGVSSEGICGCACLSDSIALPEFDGGKLHFCTMTDYSGKEAEFVQDPKSGKCYQLKLDQGPCKNNEWLERVEPKDNETGSDELKCMQCAEELIEYRNCPVPIVVASSPAAILPNECEEGTKYSKLLRKCVKKVSGGNFFG